MAGDLSLNLLDHRTNKEAKYYLNLTFQNFLIPAINKPTRITKIKATLTDHILTNDYVNTNSSTGIVKSEISHHFPIFLIMNPQYFNSIHIKTTI